MFKYFGKLLFWRKTENDIEYSSDESEQDVYISVTETNKSLLDKYGKEEMHQENLKDLELSNLTILGSGGFSLVMESYSEKYKTIVAIKIIRLDENKSYVEKFLPIELDLWGKLSTQRHKNILNLFEQTKVDSFQYIITELAKKGDLSEFLLAGPLTEAKSKSMFKDIVAAVKFCHDQGIAHRDIKPENLLIGTDGKLKLADFSFVTQKDVVISERCGTPRMLAPEQTGMASYNPYKSDIWQVGITLYTMLLNQFPFKFLKKNEIQTEIRTHKNVYKNVPYPRNRMISSACKDVIAGMLNVEPTARFSIQDVSNAKWLTGM